MPDESRADVQSGDEPILGHTELGSSEGQPDSLQLGPDTTEKQSVQDTSSESEQLGGDSLEKPTQTEETFTTDQYKELQGQFTKVSQSASDLEKIVAKFGGMDNVLQHMEFLSGNERFGDWLKGERQRELTGGEPGSELDEETKKALGIVENVADERINRAIHDRVDPLAEQLKGMLLEKTMGLMDDKHGDSWRKYGEDMKELSTSLPQSVQDNPSVKDMEALYYRALSETGDIEKVMRAKYEANLQDKKSKSIIPPGAPQSIAPKKSTNMAEALGNAEKLLGKTLDGNF